MRTYQHPRHQCGGLPLVGRQRPAGGEREEAHGRAPVVGALGEAFGERVRLGTTDAGAAHARLREAGATLHNDQVVHIDGAPPMFFFADPDGNGLVYLEEPPGGAEKT